MITYNRGDIILVPFPFSDQTTTKKRPAVIISSDTFNSVSSDIIICAITSKTSAGISTGECLIENWKEAGLLKPSAIKPAVSTIEASLIIKKLGKLSPHDASRLTIILQELFDL